MKTVFISHSSKDLAAAKEVYNYLIKNGVPCWMDIYDITPSIPYARAIMEGITKSSAMVVLYSKNVNTSDDILNEIDQAHSNKMALFPYLLDDSSMSQEVSYYLKRRQWIIAYPDYHIGLEKLLAALKDCLNLPETSRYINIALMGAPSSGRSSIVNEINSIITGNGPISDVYYPEPISYGSIKNAEGCYIEIQGRKGKIRLYDINTDYPLEVIKASDAIILNIDLTMGWTNIDRSIISEAARKQVPILAICMNKADMLCDETKEFEREVKRQLELEGLPYNIPIVATSALGALNGVPEWTDRIQAVIDELSKCEVNPISKMEQIHYTSSTDVIEAEGSPDDATEEVARCVVSHGLTSTSDLQRYLGFGYARINRIMDTIERLGIVGPATTSGRALLVHDLDELEKILDNWNRRLQTACPYKET